MRTVDSDTKPGAFATTRWTLVLRARGQSSEARHALSDLCGAYWKPVFEFLRCGGLAEDEARDAAQEFFARLLARGGLETADPARGRFRSYLLGAVRHFLSDRRDRQRAEKRGGGREHVPLGETGTLETEAGLGAVGSMPLPIVAPPVDQVFDREWAVTLVNRAVDRLTAEQAAVDRGTSFAALKPLLLGAISGLNQSEVARSLGWTENAVRVAVHRLRRRFRELVQAEVAQTVEEPAEAAAEIRYLLEVLSS